jgi:hypothetical protein
MVVSGHIVVLCSQNPGVPLAVATKKVREHLVSSFLVGCLLIRFQPGSSFSDRPPPGQNHLLRETRVAALPGLNGVGVVWKLGDAEPIVLHQVVVVVLAYTSRSCQLCKLRQGTLSLSVQGGLWPADRVSFP